MNRSFWGVLAVLGIAALATPGVLVLSQTGAPDPARSHDSHHHGEVERWFNMRLVGSDGEVLMSTWPGEDGALEVRQQDRDLVGPIEWHPEDREPVLEPLMDMLDEIPPDVSVRIDRYNVPVVEPETVVLDRVYETPIQGEIGLGDAGGFLGNTTAGARVLFLGLIPLDVLENDGERLIYRFDLEAPAVYNVTRSEGLQIQAEPLPGEGRVRFTLHAAEGTFLAHNNCVVPNQMIPWGFYVVREATPGTLVLDRYDKEAEHLLQGRTVSLEVEFYEAGALTTEPDGFQPFNLTESDSSHEIDEA